MNSSDYIKSEGLDELIAFTAFKDYKEGPYDFVSGKLQHAIPPDIEDLVRIHRLIRQRKCFTVLEFGTGYSTIVIAHALAANKTDWNNMKDIPEIRNRFMFNLFTVDASEKWIKETEKKIPEKLKCHIHFHFSEVNIGTFNGQICHFYTNLPDVIPDFIYLDGPNPKDVNGSVNGMTFHCDERTVMSGDLLTMEPTFLPGLFILIDGRTNNVRFLLNNFKRKYQFNWDKGNDISTFELIEERLGKYNKLGFDSFK